MGLDQFAYRVKASDDQSRSNLEGREEICYWRKHPNLHGWMEQLYIERGGKESFNCIPLQLFEKDLDALEKDIKSNKLPHTSGFFFGESLGDKDEQECDLNFIKKAKESIDAGYSVYYDSWW